MNHIDYIGKSIISGYYSFLTKEEIQIDGELLKLMKEDLISTNATKAETEEI